MQTIFIIRAVYGTFRNSISLGLCRKNTECRHHRLPTSGSLVDPLGFTSLGIPSAVVRSDLGHVYFDSHPPYALTRF